MAAETTSSRGFTPARRLMAAAFVMDLGVAVIGLSVQFKARELGATPLQLGMLGSFGALSYAVFCLLTGRLSDSWGRRLLASASCVGCGIVWLIMTQAGSPAQLLCLVPFSGASIALFWPTLQAWLSQVSASPSRLTRNIGDFNVSWTIGLMFGAPVAGLLWGYGQHVPFVFAAAIILLLLVFMQTVRGGNRSSNSAGPEPMGEAPVDPTLTRQFLYLAWIANFAAWFSRGLTNVVFPKLANELGMGERLIGMVIATFLAGQLLTFIYLRRQSGWQYRLWPLGVALVWAAAGMTVAYFARTPVVFTAGFAMAGMGAGVTYFASLYYSLQGHVGSRGARSGIHEAVLGSGVFFGPLAGGAVANYVDLHTPFLLAAGVFALTALVISVVWSRTVRRTRADLALRASEVTCK